MAYTLLATGSFYFFIFDQRTRTRELARLLFGFGLLFIGLDHMKSSIAQLAHNIDLSVFQGHSIFLYFLVGFGLTTIIQSSSACMVIILSALDVQLVDFYSATGLVLGADLGTTLTVFLGAFKGSVDKKRLALGHFSYNLGIDIITLIFLPYIIYFIFEVINIKDHLIALVFFHTFFNTMGVIIIYPSLGIFQTWLENVFKSKHTQLTKCDLKEPHILVEASLAVINEEVKNVMTKVLNFNYHMFVSPSEYQKFKLTEMSPEKSFLDNYHELKMIEGEIFDYSILVRNQELSDKESKRIEQLIQALRSFIFAAKGIKDIHSNLVHFYNSNISEQTALFQKARENYFNFLQRIEAAYMESETFLSGDFLPELKGLNSEYNSALLAQLISHQDKSYWDRYELSTFFNFLSEIHASNITLLRGIENLVLDKSQAEKIQENVEFI